MAQFEAERVPVNVYVSTRTGMRVMMAKVRPMLLNSRNWGACTCGWGPDCLLLGQVEGPLVNAYLTLATEARTTGYADKDDGLPHALEHLVFMGEEGSSGRGREAVGGWVAEHDAIVSMPASSCGCAVSVIFRE